MAAMRLEKLRQVDLNLLITFAAIAEEKSVTAADVCGHLDRGVPEEFLRQLQISRPVVNNTRGGMPERMKA
jgi:hypothetical protein